MESRRWYYAIDEDNKIGISEEDLKTLFVTGKLGLNTLVWTETMTSWKPANEYDEFRTIPKDGKGTTENTRLEDAFTQVSNEIKYIRPWKRFIARMADYVIYGILLMLLHDIVNSYIYPFKIKLPFLVFFAAQWICVLIEAILISLWGTTPGKWLLNIHVKNTFGDRLRFDISLIRSLNVFVKGIGLGIPVINIITMIISYNQLLRDGKSSWDIEEDNIIEFRDVGLVRSAFIALMIIIIIILLDYYFFNIM